MDVFKSPRAAACRCGEGICGESVVAPLTPNASRRLSLPPSAMFSRVGALSVRVARSFGMCAAGMGASISYCSLVVAVASVACPALEAYPCHHCRRFDRGALDESKRMSLSCKRFTSHVVSLSLRLGRAPRSALLLPQHAPSTLGLTEPAVSAMPPVVQALCVWSRALCCANCFPRSAPQKPVHGTTCFTWTA